MDDAPGFKRFTLEEIASADYIARQTRDYPDDVAETRRILAAVTPDTVVVDESGRPPLTLRELAEAHRRAEPTMTAEYSQRLAYSDLVFGGFEPFRERERVDAERGPHVAFDGFGLSDGRLPAFEAVRGAADGQPRLGREEMERLARFGGRGGGEWGFDESRGAFYFAHDTLSLVVRGIDYATADAATRESEYEMAERDRDGFFRAPGSWTAFHWIDGGLDPERYARAREALDRIDAGELTFAPYPADDRRRNEIERARERIGLEL